jgi:class 3 adenylate cyclase
MTDRQAVMVTSTNPERRLTAILAADIVGYSRLMGADEEGTLAQLKALHQVVIAPKISEHRGRIVDTAGDGMLVEFASAVDATRCAIEIQRQMIERSADTPASRRMQLRVGINIGDVIVEGERIYGDGVNVAARLEGIAEPGGICISEDAYRQIRGRVDGDFQEIGEQQLKNIARPVRVYRLRLGRARAPIIPAVQLKRFAAGTLALLLLVGLIGIYQMNMTLWVLRALGVSARTDASGTAPEPAAPRSARSLQLEATALLHDALLARMAAYAIPADEAEAAARNYEMELAHKAIAASLEKHRTFSSARWVNANGARIAALEGCQIENATVCGVIAVDDQVEPLRDGQPALQDMPRARYAGLFDPDQVPDTRAEVVRRADVQNYRSAAEPKAVALHLSGRMFVAVDAKSQFEAESQALAACNDDPVVKRAVRLGSPCFLYAVGNQVVLGQRLLKPLSRQSADPAPR